MSEDAAELLIHVREIRKLLELLAEPAIAQRDSKLRGELRRIVGRSVPKRQSVLLMNGSRRQKEIHEQTGINRGELSTLITKLGGAKLLTGDPKVPKMAISIPSNFFEQHAETD